jgi:hypothetical protein
MGCLFRNQFGPNWHWRFQLHYQSVCWILQQFRPWALPKHNEFDYYYYFNINYVNYLYYFYSHNYTAEPESYRTCKITANASIY